MFLHWFCQSPKRSAGSARPGRMGVPGRPGFRPQLEELEDRRVLSYLHPALTSIPTGPCAGTLLGTVSVIGIASGPCIPTGPCYPTGPLARLVGPN